MKLASSAPFEFIMFDARGAVDRARRSVFPEHSRRQFYWVAHQGIKLERSDADPPLVRSRDGSWQDLSPNFEEILGSYEAKARKITIYKKGIVWCAASRARNWNPAQLERIVELHEWAHVLHHLGAAEPFEESTKVRELRLRSNRYRKAPEEFKEQIAQLLALLLIRGEAARDRPAREIKYLNNLEEMFFALMDDQSSRYHLPAVVRATDFDRLRVKARLILAIADKEYFPSLTEIHGILA